MNADELDDEELVGEIGSQIDNGVERNAIGDEEVMQESKQEHSIEAAATTFEK